MFAADTAPALHFPTDSKSRRDRDCPLELEQLILPHSSNLPSTDRLVLIDRNHRNNFQGDKEYNLLQMRLQRDSDTFLQGRAQERPTLLGKRIPQGSVLHLDGKIRSDSRIPLGKFQSVQSVQIPSNRIRVDTAYTRFFSSIHSRWNKCPTDMALGAMSFLGSSSPVCTT